MAADLDAGDAAGELEAFFLQERAEAARKLLGTVDGELLLSWIVWPPDAVQRAQEELLRARGYPQVRRFSTTWASR